MTKTMRETTSVIALGSVTEERNAVKTAFQEVQSSFETFCLLAGIEAFQDLLEDEAADLCGERHQRHEGPARSPLGKGPEPSGLSWRSGRHRTAAGSDTGRPAGTGTSQPCRGPARGLAGPLGDEPDADQRLDPAVPALGSPARRRCHLDQG